MIIEAIHERCVKNRRAVVLHNLLCKFFPDQSATVLDIGCGDGGVARYLMQTLPGLQIKGIDPLVRSGTAIPVQPFNGREIPHAAGSFDYCLLVDVLHHAEDPKVLLLEAARVAKKGVIIKDHYAQGLFARTTLRFMDDAHNRRYGVSLPYNYWSPEQWQNGFERAGLVVQQVETRLHLYPIWADWLFGRGLHFISRLGFRRV